MRFSFCEIKKGLRLEKLMPDTYAINLLSNAHYTRCFYIMTLSALRVSMISKAFFTVETIYYFWFE